MIPIVNDCRSLDTKDVKPLEYITENMFCAGGLFGKGFCNADEGGPLVCQGPDDSKVLTGIASFRRPETECTDYPGIFTKVANYLPFIHESIGTY